MSVYKARQPSRLSQRAVEVCETIEATGVIDLDTLFARLSGITRQNLRKLCDRCVLHRLLTLETHKASRAYKITPFWRDVVAKRGVTKTVPRATTAKVRPKKDREEPISHLVIEMCEILEEYGPGTVAKISRNMPEMDLQSISATCRRGLAKGVILSTGTKIRAITYSVAPDWRVVTRMTEKDYKIPEQPPTKWRGINSPFQMAEKWGLSE